MDKYIVINDLGVSKDDFHDWKTSEISTKIFKTIAEERSNVIEYIAKAGTIHDPIETARLIGNIEALDFLLDVKYESEEENIYEAIGKRA